MPSKYLRVDDLEPEAGQRLRFQEHRRRQLEDLRRNEAEKALSSKIRLKFVKSLFAKKIST